MAEGNQTIPEGSGGTGESTQPPAWVAQLPTELRTNQEFTKYKTIGELGKAYLDLNGKTANAVQLPGENATENELNSFYDKLGRPKDPKEYKFSDTKLPPLYDSYKDLVEEDTNAFKQMAHKLGLTGKQADALHQLYFDRLNYWTEQTVKADEMAKEEAKKSLQKVWGDQLVANTELAHRAVMAIAEKAGIAKEFETYINTPSIGNNPVFIRLFAEIGKAMSEDSTMGTKFGKEGDGSQVKRDSIGRPILDFPSMKK